MSAFSQPLAVEDVKEPIIDRQELTMDNLVEAYLLEHLVRPVTAHTYRQCSRRWVEETGNRGDRSHNA